MSSSERVPTTLILGAGTFGTSTAYHLALSLPAQQASSITILDRAPSPKTAPSPLAASSDINKIIRSDYTSPFYCDLATDAINAWSTWDALRPYYHRSGWVMLERQGGDLAERIRAVLRARRGGDGGDPTEDVSLAEVEERWGGVLKGTELEGFRDGYWNGEAGWCEASAATGSLLQKTLRFGVNYVSAEVEELVLDGLKTRIQGVRTKDGRVLTADRIVLATGAWTSALLSPIEDGLAIPSPDRVEKQAQAAGVAVAHYKMSPTEMDQLRDMPVVVYDESGEVIPPPKSNQLLKYTNSLTFTNTITTQSGHEISVPPDRDQHTVSEKLKRETDAMMSAKVMPAFTRGKKAEYHRLCWDARTPTQDWLLCKHPDARLGNLFLAVGGSFHSYKFLPTVGLYMVNVLNGKSNGVEKDRAWGWKDFGDGKQWRGAHESTAPKRELSELEDEEGEEREKARL